MADTLRGWVKTDAPALRRDPLGTYLAGWRAQGDVVRFRLGGPFEAFLVIHPHGVERVLREANQRYGKVPWHNDRFVELLGHGLATSEGDLWLSRRRLLQPAFHRDHIGAMVDTMVDAAEDVVERWSRLPHDSTVDMSVEMMSLTLSVAARTLLGVDPKDDARRVGPSIEETLRHLIRRIESLIAWPLWVPLPANRRFVRARAELDEFIAGLIEQRRRDRTGPPTFLDILLDTRDAETGAPLDDREIRDEVMTMLMAGHESTSVALTWAWYLLDRHPNEFEAMRAEVSDTVGDRRLTIDDLQGLRRTSMIIDETLRLYPPAWSTTRAPLEDDVIGGRRIPRGHFVIVSPYVTHRHPAFWSDPDAFRPSRFSAGMPSGPDRFAYFPFGGGPRQCMGTQFALTEARIVLATIARRFRPSLAPGHVVGIDPQVTLRPRGGMPMLLRKA
jgi:cytochrome P450